MHTKTLLLTPWYFPMQVLRWEDAVKMIYEGVVDVIVEYDETISSPSVTWKMPAVIRLRRLPRREQTNNRIKFSRQNVYARDGKRCQYCGGKFDERELSYDHVVPRSAGGRRAWDNIVTACKPCNLRKANHTCDDVGMWPINQPKQPKNLPIHGPVIDMDTAPNEWHGYLGGWAR